MKDILFILSLLIILGMAIVINNTMHVNSTVSAVKAEVGFSKETEDLSLLSHNIKWTPDSHISYITFPNGVRRYFISGNQKTYSLDSSKDMSLKEAIKSNPQLKESFGPDKNVLHRNGYSTIGSVLQTDKQNPYHVFAFTQNEQQKINDDGSLDYGNFTTSVGLLESKDGGATWSDLGPVIRGDDYIQPGIKITGAGQPSAIIIDNYVYIYYASWSANGYHSDQIYAARASIGPDGSISNFEFYKEGGFSTGENNLKPVIEANKIENGYYAALPSISYNKALKKYFAVYETNRGFATAESENGLDWTKHKLIFYFTKPLSERTTGDIWNSYPTLLSDDTENNDQTTTNKGNLYFSQGVWPNTAHQLTSKEFEL